jgi:hypothetical protein
MSDNSTMDYGTTSLRTKFYSANLQKVLRNALIAEKICDVDRSDSYTIKNPYGSQPTTVISALTGTYDVSTYGATDDTLTVTDEFKLSEHIYDFENLLSNFDLFASRADEQAYSVAASIDSWVLNNWGTDCTGTYTTPTGGFTTAANINTIMANLTSKLAGYSESYKGMFLVIENTDLVGFQIAGATNGFSMADAVLSNGFAGRWMGVDIYVARTGTFVTSTLGTKSVVMSGHRLFGVKGVATYAEPRGVRYEEKAVSGKTGMETVTFGYTGFAAWTQKRALAVDITLA